MLAQTFVALVLCNLVIFSSYSCFVVVVVFLLKIDVFSRVRSNQVTLFGRETLYYFTKFHVSFVCPFLVVKKKKKENNCSEL
mmetsp:Transcript_23857/g.56325  ORF Transcript_23857/g.56325 Transcript_23857/m.56325 type:complete len:82 (+) Transcript_23857:275-520(+)